MRYLYLMLLCGLSLQAQVDKGNSFDSPLRIDIIPSGTFGELRNNHFHAGLDIRTQQKTGFPIYAPFDGYVSRIKVSSFGYGKALYIDHPNGITTVYGHLEAYNGDIAAFVKKRHYNEQSFEIEIFSKKNELPVKKGDIIGFSGNSGGSGGPHLHYEFRDTKTQQIINPLGYGMEAFITDTKVPIVNSITVYAIGEGALANQLKVPTQLNYKKKGNELFVAPIKAKGLIGFGVNSHDESDFNYAKNGLYSVEASLNGEVIYNYIFDTFSFAEARYVNALIDYSIYTKTNQRIQKIFAEKPFPLSVLKKVTNKGLIDVKPGESYSYKIVLSDFYKNETIIHIPIEYSSLEGKSNSKENAGIFIDSGKEYIFEKENFVVEFPVGVFYNDFYLNISADDKQLSLHDNTVPIHKNIKITFDAKGVSGINNDRAFLGRISEGKTVYYTTQKKGSKFIIRTRDFGVYRLVNDFEVPIIYEPSFSEGEWLTNRDRIEFYVKDDLSGIESITGFINEKWVLFDYDYKTNKIVHLFEDGIVTSGRNELSIVVKDRVGNEAIFQTHFYIK